MDAARDARDARRAYDVLGVDERSTPDEIRSAFRKAALLHHPDKGGDRARFDEIVDAYAGIVCGARVAGERQRLTNVRLDGSVCDVLERMYGMLDDMCAAQRAA